MVNERMEKVIEELKVVREKKGISYQEIANRTMANGEPVSLSTIKIVFNNKVRHNHNYENVILPIARALSPEDKNDDADYMLLEARLELKDYMLKEKDKIIEELRSRLKTKEQKYKDRESFYIEQINYFKEQTKNRDEHIKNRDSHIINLDEHIKRLDEAINRKDAFIRESLLNT